MNDKKLIQSLVRAGEILDIVSENKDGISLKEIADKLNLGSSTVFYLINTLTYLGFVKQNKNNKYKLGPKNLYLGNNYLENLSIYNIALPLLEKIIDEFNENVYLVMLENTNFLSLIKLESTHSVRPTKVANERKNAHATAIGKILLSSFSKDELNTFVNNFDELHKFTSNTIISLEKLHIEMDMIRERGYALDLEESEMGINCIAVPIHDHKEEVKAAIGTSIPSQRFSEEIKDKILPSLKSTAYQISVMLGYKEIT